VALVGIEWAFVAIAATEQPPIRDSVALTGNLKLLSLAGDAR
jgi:hypothetical protein